MDETMAAKAAFEVFQNRSAFDSKEMFKKSLVKALMENGRVTLKEAENMADKVEIGLSYSGAQDPLKVISKAPVMDISTLRYKLTEAAIESFAAIFGLEKGKKRAEEFVMLLIGDEKNLGKDALLYQLADQLKALMQLNGGSEIPEIKTLLKETLIHTLDAQTKPDIDAFILNEALLSNGNKLLSTVHEALMNNIGGGLPLQI